MQSSALSGGKKFLAVCCCRNIVFRCSYLGGCSERLEIEKSKHVVVFAGACAGLSRGFGDLRESDNRTAREETQDEQGMIEVEILDMHRKLLVLLKDFC